MCVFDKVQADLEIFLDDMRKESKFGASGKEEEKFKNPFSTAVLSDGRINVTDFGNHRVQVFLKDKKRFLVVLFTLVNEKKRCLFQ